MYEALLKATPEYEKIASSFAKPGPAALFGLPPAGRALLYAALLPFSGKLITDTDRKKPLMNPVCIICSHSGRG